MTFGNSEKLQTAIPTQNIDDFQSNNEEQQLEDRYISVNEREKNNIHDPKSRKNSNKQQSFFINDLIKMIQLSLIIALLVFIGILSYAIVIEVREFWFQTQARSVTDTENLKRINQPIIKVELASNEILANEDKLQNMKQKGALQEKKQNEHQQKLLEIVSKQNSIENIKVMAVETEQKKESSEVIIDNSKDVELQQRSDQKKQQSVTPSTMKQIITSNPNAIKPQPIQDPSQKNDHDLNPQNVQIIKQTPLVSSNPSTTHISPQVYDPVLIEINKMRKKSGNKFKDSIYTMRNTQITEQQYNMARQLIQVSQFYNPKEGKFDVQHTYKCSSQQQHSQCILKKQQQISSIIQHEKAYYHQRYKQPWIEIQQQHQQLPLCIIVPSYKNNHANNIFNNLNSIFQQQYTNYHVIYIDDHSQDGTPQKVHEYMNMYGIKEDKLELYVNQQNQKALSNIYKAAHSYCHLKEIMIIVDGDDYLIGTQVLRLLNFHYQTKKLLAAYTNYLRINQPYYVKVGTSTPYPKTIVDKRAFRKNYNIFRASHLRSFYVDLFRRIKPEDLQDQNKHFFTAANDFAIMMPILEMSSPHVQYIPELTYLYDSGTGLNNFQSKKGVQAANAKIISRRKIYPPVDINEFYKRKYVKKQ